MLSRILWAAVGAVLVLGAAPGARAQCTLSMECAAASGIPNQSRPYPSAEACERDRAMATAEIARMGGGCSYRCDCGPGAGTATGAIPPVYSPESLRDQMLLNLSSQLGMAIGEALFGNPEQEAAQRAIAAQQLEERRRRLEAAEQERRARLAADKAALRGAMKTGTSGSIEWKGSSPRRLAYKFDDFVKREAERRAVFERTTDVWCKLHPPLQPTSPIMAIPADQFRRMAAYYELRKREWDQRCQALGLTPPEGAATGPGAGGAGRDGGTGDPYALPMSCSDCWTVYDRAARGCESSGSSNLDVLICVNGALDSWVLCLGGCRSEPTAPVTPGP